MEVHVLDDDSARPVPPELFKELALREAEFLARRRTEVETRRAVSDDGKTTVRILDRWKDPVPRGIFQVLSEAEERELMATHEKTSAKSDKADPTEAGQAKASAEEVVITPESKGKESSKCSPQNAEEEAVKKSVAEGEKKSSSSSDKSKKRGRGGMTMKVSAKDPPRTCLEWLTGERGKKKAKIDPSANSSSSVRPIPNPPSFTQKSKMPPVRTQFDTRDPYLKRQWPPELRRRIYVEQMPGPKAAKLGKVLLLWLRPVSSRMDNSFTMAFIQWLHERLKMPIFAVILFDPDFPSILHSTTDSRRSKCREDIPGVIDLFKSFQDLKIPLVGMYVVQKDTTSFFAQVTRKCGVHAIVTSDNLVFGKKKFLKTLTKCIPCPLFLVDNDALVPTRYLPREILSIDTHRKSFIDAAEALSAYELNQSKVQSQIQASLSAEVTNALPSRWKQVNFDELENVEGKAGTDLPTRLQLTESCGLEVLRSYCKEHLEEMRRRGSSCHYFAEILIYVVCGKLSALQVIKQLKDLNAYEPESRLVDAIFKRERRRYVAYRTLREALERQPTTDSELMKFFKRDSAQETIPTWAHLLPERAYAELNTALEDEHHPDSQKKVFLPADIESGITTDSFFNSIQESLVNRGTIIENVMGFWVQQIVGEFTDNPLHGLKVAIKLLEDYLPGSTSLCDNIAHVLDQGFSRFNELHKHPVLGSIQLCTVSQEERDEVLRAQERALARLPSTDESAKS